MSSGNKTNAEPKVLTVSVAAYNVEDYLAKALESCIVPNMDLLEVIVVDDGSSDSTAEIARGYVDRYPSTFKLISKENGGYGSTLNASLEAASGVYYRFLDGDDWFDRTELEGFLDFLSGCDAEAVFTPYTRCYEADGREEVVNNFSGVSLRKYELEGFEFNDEVAACALTYRTWFLRRVGLRLIEHCFYTDSMYAYIPLSFARTLYVTGIDVYRYRIGREGQSVSVESIVKHHDDVLTASKAVFSALCLDSGEISPAVVCRPYALRILSRCVASPFAYVCLCPPSKEEKTKLLEFDAFVSRYPEVYAASGQYSKRVRLLRASRFILYRPICRLTARG